MDTQDRYGIILGMGILFGRLERFLGLVIFDIAGMRCGACAIGIELALAKKNGVKSTKVSLNERMAVVEYDPATVTASDISKAVKDLGYIAIARS